jgi:hypothetical protein
MHKFCDACREHICNPKQCGIITFDRVVQYISASAAAGCSSCGLFDQYLDARILEDGLVQGRAVREMFFDPKIGRRFPDFIKEKMTARIHLKLHSVYVSNKVGRDHIPSGPVDITLRFIFKSPEGKSLGPKHADFFSNKSDIEHIVKNTPISADMESDSTFRQARTWLNTCIEQHDDCTSSANDFVPTRLLQIAQDVSDKPVKLVETAAIPKDTRYATLSHCWGSKVVCTLSSSNIDEFKANGVSRELLSRSFMDALKIARELGLCYIWIDSLCIIQDSQQDWAEESVQMHRVYGNSTCNIAATSAQNGSAGCFRQRNPNFLKPLKLEFDSHGQLETENQHCAEDGNEEKDNGAEVFYLTDVEEWWRRFEQEPLHQRAWVVQERVLSPRVLHFEWDQLVWECNQLKASEKYPVGLGTLVPQDKPVLRQQVDAKLRIEQESQVPGLALKNIWRPIVEAYTATAITEDTDRLVAIQGVGVRMQDAYGWKYVAGMFPQMNLVSQMLWRPKRGGSGRRPEKRIAPSWSWASIVGAPVQMMPQWLAVQGGYGGMTAEELDETPLCRVTKLVELVKKVKNDIMMTNHARLEVDGYLLPVSFDRRNFPEICRIRNWQAARESEHRSELGTVLSFNLTTNWNARNSRGGRTWVHFLRGGLEELMSTLSQLCNWQELRHWLSGNTSAYPFKSRWHRASELAAFETLNRPGRLGVHMQYDVWDEFYEGSDLWLMPVYNVQQSRSDGYFGRTVYGSLEGLVLERAHLSDGNGKNETVFRRCGVFQVMPKHGLWEYTEDHTNWPTDYDLLDMHMRSLWDGFLQFNQVEGVKCSVTDGVYYPDFDNWKKNRGAYMKRDDVPQYKIIIV